MAVITSEKAQLGMSEARGLAIKSPINFSKDIYYSITIEQKPTSIISSKISSFIMETVYPVS